jgi:hypothetical protein
MDIRRVIEIVRNNICQQGLAYRLKLSSIAAELNFMPIVTVLDDPQLQCMPTSS